ncbi:phosphoribosylanthranilate isomerase [Rufibacter soli]
MALNTIVLVNQITNLSDARYCAGMGVEMLGFSLQAGQSQHISPAAFKEISGWVSGVKLVGEVTDLPVNELEELLLDYKVDLLQLNSLYYIEELDDLPLPIIMRVMIDKDSVEEKIISTLELYHQHVEYFLIDSEDFSLIDETNLRFLRDISKKYPILLGFGLNKANTKEALDRIQPAGIALKGGQEIRPGYKNFDELEEIFEQLED